MIKQNLGAFLNEKADEYVKTLKQKYKDFDRGEIKCQDAETMTEGNSIIKSMEEKEESERESK